MSACYRDRGSGSGAGGGRPERRPNVTIDGEDCLAKLKYGLPWDSLGKTGTRVVDS
jgi:hypothetical protein